MKQRLRPLTPGFFAEYGPEFLRNILIALVAFLLAIPVRHAQEALLHMVHRGQDRPAVAQLWPSRGVVPADLLP